ncbi:MAG: glycoside hydrolase family 2 TIM barrel-domain containing protein [Verrucomicrobiota bacterium]
MLTSFAARETLNINPVWRFQLADSAEAHQVDYDDSAWDVASLPHSFRIWREDLTGYENLGRKVGWYRREIEIPRSAAKKKIFLVFQGAMQTTKLWINGKPVGEHAVSGYDSFHFDITDYVSKGKNLVAVRVDNTVNGDIPPDGGRLDFVLFGGLYRDVDLVITEPLRVTFPWEAREAGTRLTLPNVSEEQAVVQIETAIRNDRNEIEKFRVINRVRDARGKLVTSVTDTVELAKGEGMLLTQMTEPIRKPKLWSPDSPYLYTVETSIKKGFRTLDSVATTLGIRWVEWDKQNGFFLNGKHTKLLGTNRHQTWPFIGNAVPNSLHRADAEQLKELGVNWVRLSHYPHDPDFLDDLDELGIMSLAEGPTWLNSNGDVWMDNLEKSFRSMIRRDRNHPSIIIWNACINHGPKEPRLVQAAMEEDPTRARGQDDVRAPMDFHHPKVSGKGALTIEHTGHTFKPARDGGEYGQAKRHWEMTESSYKEPGNYGTAVWSMYDYNTFHPNYAPSANHGICTLLHIPKLSYFWHQSEMGNKPFTYVYPREDGGVTVFSNADEVKFYEIAADGSTRFTKTLKPDVESALLHPPMRTEGNSKAAGYLAEGLVGGEVVSEHRSYHVGEPVALKLSTWRSTITADGSDLSEALVQLVDENGMVVTGSSDEVEFFIEGEGRLVGENPSSLRKGQYRILIGSTFEPGDIKLSVKAKGNSEWTPASIEFETRRPGKSVDMPEAPVPAPTRNAVEECEEVLSANLFYPYSVSSFQRGRIPNKAFDGNPETSWRAGNGSQHQYLAVDLGRVRKLRGATIQWEYDDRIYIHDIEVSNDGENWKSVSKSKDMTGIIEHEFKAEARHIRMRNTGKLPKARACVREFVLHFSDEAAATGWTQVTPVVGAEPGALVESNPIMVGGRELTLPIHVEGCEYKNYASDWSAEPGHIRSGDAVFFRMRAPKTAGGKVTAKIRIGDMETEFTVESKGDSSAALATSQVDLDRKGGKVYKVDFDQQYVEFITQTAYDPKRDEGSVRHKLYWDGATKFVEVNVYKDLEQVQAPRPSIASLYWLDQKSTEALQAGQQFVARFIDIDLDATEPTGLRTDGRLINAEYTPTGKRTASVKFNGRDVPMKGGYRMTAKTFRQTTKDFLKTGLFDARVFGSDQDGKFVLDRLELTTLPDPRETDDPDLPRVLVIGDSISVNYNNAAKDALAGVVNYHRIAGNGGSTVRGVESIDLWLGNYWEKGFHWDAIQFNFGLHDLRQGRDAESGEWKSHGVEIDDYKKNLEIIISMLKETGAELIWCNTTPVPNDGGNTSGRRKDEDLIYNKAALEVVSKYPEITITDVNGAVRNSAVYDEWRKGSNVHFNTPQVQKVLGDTVADGVRLSLNLN